MVKNIYCNDLHDFVQKIHSPNPTDVYIYVPLNFKAKLDAEKKILDVVSKNSFVYSDIEIHKNNKIIPQLFPSYNVNHNIAINLPIYLNCDKPIFINAKSSEEVFGQIWKQLVGYHIPEILFECHL